MTFFVAKVDNEARNDESIFNNLDRWYIIYLSDSLDLIFNVSIEATIRASCRAKSSDISVRSKKAGGYLTL